MAIEIEHKFLINPLQKDNLILSLKDVKSELIAQGYLSTDKERTVRVRIKNDKGFITIKGLSNGLSRPEYEYEIPLMDAQELLKLCEYSIIKERYTISANNNLFWEIDFFKDKNEGLIVAEIEVPNEYTFFDKPEWIGLEVSNDHRYANSSLAMDPILGS
jgi:adenylate cyclase